MKENFPVTQRDAAERTDRYIFTLKTNQTILSLWREGLGQSIP